MSGYEQRQTCAGTKRDGSPCTVRVLLDGSYRFAHASGAEQRRRESRRRGGRGRSTSVRLGKLMPKRLIPVFSQLEDALSDVLAGELDPKRAAAAASVGRALVAVLTAGEMEARLRALEEARDAD